MNTIYKVIWNDALRVYQVVNELCSSHRKACSVKAVHVEKPLTQSVKQALTAIAAVAALIPAAQALDFDPSYQINIGESTVVGGNDNIPTFTADQLPQEGGILTIDKSVLTGFTTQVYQQDESRDFTIFKTDKDLWDPDNITIQFVDQEGNPLDDTDPLGSTNAAAFYYDAEFLGMLKDDAHVAFTLKRIDLLSNQGMGQRFDVSATDPTDPTGPEGIVDDLKSAITGGGNITFSFTANQAGGNTHGYLRLADFDDVAAGTQTNTYSGWTFVGFDDYHAESDSVTIYFGKDKAFGNTENLEVATNSEVWFGDLDRQQAYTQTVHGLQGAGLLDLGSNAKLTLAQSGTATGNVSDGDETIRIDNEFAGSDNAWFEIDLSNQVAGYEVWFSNKNESKYGAYTGGISLANGVIQSYNDKRQITVDDDIYTPNAILNTATLRLENGGQLLTSGSGIVHNLIINNSGSWTSGAENSNALAFSTVDLGTTVLQVTGDLTLQSDATVNVDSLGTEGLEGAVSGKSFFDADEGLESVLIEVVGNVSDNGHQLTLAGDAVSGSGTAVMQGGEQVAEAKWNFDSTLQFAEGTGDANDTYSIRYQLAEVNISGGKIFSLSTKSGNETQNFTALLSGDGDLEIDAPGKTIEIGHNGGNAYTGDTVVTNETNVVLTENAALGTGSGALTIEGSGSVVLNQGVQQSGSGLSGTGSLTINSGAAYTLNGSGDTTITNTILGSGSFNVDLGGTDNELKFSQTDAFNGALSLSHGSLNLVNGSTVLESSKVTLGFGSAITFGSGSKVDSLYVGSDADLNADTLIIGGPAGLTVTDKLTFENNRTFDVTDVEVQADIDLIDLDSDFSSNNFVNAGTFDPDGHSFSINVNGAETTSDGKLKVVRDYVQTVNNAKDEVAETTWLLDPNLVAKENEGLFAGVQLTNINVLSGKTLSIGAGKDSTLTAQLSSESNSGSIVFSDGSITVSNESNDYDVATVVNAGTTLTLGASHSLGNTSELSVAGTLVVGNGIEQTVYGWDSGASGSITLDGSLALDQTGDATIGNTFSGNGAFDVDLGDSGNSLVFSNGAAFSGFSGKLALSNLSFDVANTTNYSTLLSGTDVQLNSGAIFNADAEGSIQTGKFDFNGGTLLIGDVTAGNETAPKLSVDGDILISQSSTILLDGVNLQGTENILAADNGVTQAIAGYTGQVSGSVADLKVSGTGESEITNAGSDTPVAYGIWGTSGNVQDNTSDKTLDVNLTLEEIQLADTETGLILDASSLTAGADSTISAVITDRDQTAGKIVFSGGSITLGGSEPNTYTGETDVTGGIVTLAKDSGFGTTSKLLISNGAKVDLGNYNQTVGALEIGTDAVNAADALTGTGTLTLGIPNGAKASHIYGTNDFFGTVALANDHDLHLNSTDGLGDNATLVFNADSDSMLTLSGAGAGTFATTLSGTGDVQLIGSTGIVIAGNNSNFGGDWLLSGSSTASVSGTATNTVDLILGGSGGTVTLAGSNDKLTLTQAGSAFNVSHGFAGDGYLEVLGTGADQTFGFASQWDDFSGTMAIGSGLHMTVGGSAGTSGANNAHNLANADFILSGDSTLTVASGSEAVDTFQNLSIQNSTIVFEGTMGFGAGTDELAQLVVESLSAGTGSILNVAMPSAGSDMVGSLNQSNLLETSGLNPFQTLISTNGITGFENLQLSGGNSGTDLRQNIVDEAGTTVATGHYDYVLASGGSDNNDVGIAYTLTQVDISGNQTLTLTGSAEGAALSAKVTGNQTGDLLINGAKGSSVFLTGSNSYSGTTTVSSGVTLSAGESGLGHTENLLVSGSYVNSGTNTIGGLTVDSSGSVTLNETVLTIVHDETNGISQVDGALQVGANGELSVTNGQLIVSSNNADEFLGLLVLGDGATSATAIAQNADAFGTGTIEFVGSGSTFKLEDDAASVLKNTFSGSGTISVDLGSSGNAFVFEKDSTKLTAGSDLTLANAFFTFESGANAAMAERLDITVGQGAVLTNNGDQDRSIHGLTLAGGVLDFGAVDNDSGVFNLGGSGSLTIENDVVTTVTFDTAQSTGTRNIGDTGSELLEEGGVFDLALITGIHDFTGATTTIGDKKKIDNLQTGVDFEESRETIYQDIVSGDPLEKVAEIYRDNGNFFYDSGTGNGDGSVHIEYDFKRIDLLYTGNDNGLTINASGSLTAQVTGSGNLVLGSDAKNLSVGSTSGNTYTGATYVRDGAIVTIAQTSGFGFTKELKNEGTVALADGVSQTVGALTGDGTIELGAGSTFTLDNYLLDAEDTLISSGSANVAVNNEIQGAAGAQFVIDAAYGQDGKSKGTVTFGQANDLSGASFKLTNAVFNIDGSTDNDYRTASSSTDFILSAGTDATVDAGELTNGESYEFTELSLESGARLSVTNVTLTSSSDVGMTDAVIQTDILDLTNASSTLSVAAEIDDSFDVLANDQDQYSSIVIKYGELKGGSSTQSNLVRDPDFDLSEIHQSHNSESPVAYVKWDGDLSFGSGDSSDPNDGTVEMTYYVDSIQLADEGNVGLRLAASEGEDSALTATVTDYFDEKNNETHHGSLTFAGGEITIGSATETEANTYTGKTFVTGGSVTLAKDSGFGTTSLLTISGGSVDLASYNQTVGALSVNGTEVLKGTGTLTIGLAGDDAATTSTISGANNFAGTVALQNDHTLTLSDTSGLGSQASVSFASADEKLIVEDADGGVFGTSLLGAGSISLSGQGIEIAGGNGGFSGVWQILGDSSVSANGTSAASADTLLGSGATVNFETASGSLTLRNSGSTSWSVDEAFAGLGTLYVFGTGSDEQEFAFSRDWSSSTTFTGTMSIGSGMRFTVGGTGSGVNNAANLSQADFVLNEGSTLVVAAQEQTVDTFDELDVLGGTISLNGKFGLGAAPDELGSLQVGSLTGSGNVALLIPTGSESVAQTTTANALFDIDASDEGLFQALVTAENGAVSADGWTLNGSETTSGSGLRQDVKAADGTPTVAHAYYDYALKAGTIGDKSALGIGYDLTQVDILQTLDFTSGGSLSATVTGSGNLVVTSGSVKLTGKNTYSGTTTVAGDLEAGESGLGHTSGLILESDAKYTNAGANTVGYLDQQNATLSINDKLTVFGSQASTIAGGSVTGSGSLVLESNTLTVSGTVGGDYTGRVELGANGSGAELKLESGAAGLGTGLVNFTNSDSTVSISAFEDTTLSNTYSGAGQIDVDLGGKDNVFAFSASQRSGDFTGKLNIANATYRLWNDNGSLSEATLSTNAGAVVEVNTIGNLADRKVSSLTLGGGTLDFGELSTSNDENGQISTGSVNFVEGQHTTIDLTLAAQTDATGSAVFGTGEKLYLIEGYGSLGAGADVQDYLTLHTDAQTTTETVRQHNTDVAKLHYGSGALASDDGGIYASWNLDTIELLSNANGGFRITENGTISALVSGSGDWTFDGTGAEVVIGTTSTNHNTYTGSTSVTNDAAVTLAKDEALGDTSKLEITSGGTVHFGNTAQTIGALSVTDSGSFSLGASGSVSLSGNSYIGTANTAVSGTIAVTGSHSLTLGHEDATGEADIVLGQDDALVLDGIGTEETPAVFDNQIAAADGTSGGKVDIAAGSFVELKNTTNTANVFSTASVDGTLYVNGMDETSTALGNAEIKMSGSGTTVLSGDAAWTLNNALDIGAEATLALSAGGIGNEFKFGGTDQTINGKVTFTDLLFKLGTGSVLTNADVTAGSQTHIIVEQGDAAQQVGDLTLASGSEITFEGSMGVGNVDTKTLGQLNVSGTLTLEAGSTVHVDIDEQTGAGSSIAQNQLVQTADEGSFQNLITAGTINGTVGGISLTDSNGVKLQTVEGFIKDEDDNNVAVGSFGSVLQIQGKSFGVHYGLQAIDIVGDLTISESGTFAIDISSVTGSGSLTVSASGEGLTLSGTNGYTVATNVTGILKADEGALGQTQLLNVAENASYTNIGENKVGELESSGTLVLDEALTVANDKRGGDGVSHIADIVTGTGDLNIEQGELVVSTVETTGTGDIPGYSGDVTLGTESAGATLTLEAEAGAKFGTGTIVFANKASSLNAEASGDVTLGNLLSGAGSIAVSGTGSNDAFGFNGSQTALAAGTDVSLTNVDYSLAKAGSDVFDNASLSLASGILTVNDGTSSYADRTIAGLTVNNAEVDFGTMGGDTQKGVINLAGNELVVGEDGATFKLNAELDDLTSNDGAAALTTGESITLVTDASTGNTTGIEVIVGNDANSYSQAIYQQHAQEDSASVHAYLTGTADSGMTATDADQDGDFDLSVGLNHKALEIVDEYVVSKDGELSLKVTDHDLQASAGGLTVSGAQLTLSNEENNYHGATKVEAGAALTLGADTALGNTSELNVDDQSSVAFGGYDQTIGKIDSSGVLTSTDGEGNTLTITNGGRASGTNNDFHMNIVLNGTENLVLEDALALGDGSVTVSSADTDLVLNGIGTAETAVEYANSVGGSGGVTVSGNSNVLLTGTNNFAGGLTVEEGSTVNAEGDIYSHISTGEIALAGTANVTLTAQSTGDWDWDRKVSGAGTLHLDRADGAASGGDLVLTADSIKVFTGDISLENWSIALNETSTTFNALKGSQASLTLGAGANAEVTGDIALNGKTVTVGNGGSLTFTGVAAPGGDNDDASTLTVGELHLDDGFVIDLGVADPNVKADQLLTQDDAGGTDVKVATATNGISGDLSSGHVSVNGSTVSEDDTIRFNVVQTSTEEAKNGTVAEGIYGVKFEKTSGETADEKNLVVNYKLAGVEILGNKTLVMDGDGADETHGNTFTGFIKGSGNLEIAGDAVYLTNNTNSFTGTTTVVAGASLHAAAGALGSETASTASLNVSGAGTAYITGNNTVEGLQIAQSGKLVLGDEKTAVPEDPVTLTLKSDVTAGSRLDGNLVGNGTLMVVGSGDVYDINKADLTIVGAQGDFYGDLVLDKRAWIDLTTTGTNIFGNSSADASNQIKVSKDSLLTIHSTNALGSIFGGVFADGAGEHGGRVEITLADSSLGFMFSTKQNEAGFTGTIALQKGTIALDNLFSDALPEGSAVKALADATLELGADGRAVLNSAIGGSTGSYDAHLGGLTMKGGSIEFGSISYDAGDDSAASGAHASHIDLGGDGILDLYAPVKDEESGNIVTQSTITIAQNETNTLSSSGTEMLAADDGTSIVLIHGIGKLYANGVDVTDRAEDYRHILNDYLHLVNDAEGTQLLEQEVTIDGFGSVANVAEVVRTFDDELTFGHLSKDSTDYAVSLGYKVDQVGLLYSTDAITSADISAGAYSNDNLWQGLTITTSDKEERNVFQAAIVDGNNGAATGNLVLRGNDKGDVLTIAGNNTYHGKTWLKDGAQIAFGIDNAFGNTQALRIDDTSSVDLGTHSQTVDMLFALGDNAIKGAAGSELTVSDEAVIKGANAGFAGDINLNGDTTINNVAGLGTGTAALGSGVTLTIDGAEGDMRNSAISGGTNTSIAIENQAAVAINDGQIDDYEGSFLVADDSSLAVSTVSGGIFEFNNLNTKIEGELIIENAQFTIPKPVQTGNQKYSILQGAELTVDDNGEIVVSHAVDSNQVTDLALNDGSTITFDGGATPGVTNPDQGHIDLGGGNLAIKGDVTVKVDMGSYVNADMVEEAQEVANLPLTATDLVADKTDMILSNLVSGDLPDNFTDGEGNDYRLTLETTGADYADGKLNVGIYNDASDKDVVATGTYDYKVSLTDEGENEGLNLSYGLVGVELHETLTLKGYEDEAFDNELGVAVTGKGGLKIASGTVSITGENSYEGATTVQAGATLNTNSYGGSLGSASKHTSKLELVSAAEDASTTGAIANIRGSETVGALAMGEGTTLNLGAEAGGTSGEHVFFTIDSTVKDSHSVVAGNLVGGSDTTLAVIGDGKSDQADLTIKSANKDFLGDIHLTGAHVKLESLNSLGVSGTVVFDEDSTVEISSSSNEGTTSDNHYGEGVERNVHIFQHLLVGDGTLRVTLDNADDYFDFDARQYTYEDPAKQNFTGTMELVSGIFKFTEKNATVLQSVEVVLDENGTLDISGQPGNTVDRTIRGLTLVGGTLEFGSLSIDRVNTEAMSAHVDLMENDLKLADPEKKVQISFDQNAANNLSATGSEIVNASDEDGSKIVLIHNIGDLKVIENGEERVFGSNDRLDDYMQLDLSDTNEKQTLKQALTTNPDGELVDVATVHRNFGSFGYEDLADVDLGNAVYVDYQINSIELIHTTTDADAGDKRWEGLTVSTSEAANNLGAHLSGAGNLVIAEGTGNKPLFIGSTKPESEQNEYEGRTWVQAGADVAFAADNAFGKTSALRVDAGATVDLNGHSQIVGDLFIYGDDSLVGAAGSTLKVTGTSEISGTSRYEGEILFDSKDAVTGFVTEVEGLGTSMSIGDKYTLEVTDQTKTEGADTVQLSSNLKDGESGGGVLSIGSSTTSGNVPIELTGDNSGFSGLIQVNDGWSLAATVNGDEELADRLGKGELQLVSDAEAVIDFENSGDVAWNHVVTGGGNLVVSTDSGYAVDFTGGLDNFKGTVTVAGGNFDLAAHSGKLGGAESFVATGADSHVEVKGDNVHFDKDVIVENGASLGFEKPLDLSQTEEPLLTVDGDIIIGANAQVNINVDGELEVGETPDAPLDTSVITMADEGKLEYVIAAVNEDAAPTGQVSVNSSADLVLNMNGESGSGTTTASIDITDGGKTVATGKYDFDLAASVDRKELGISYHLTEVDVHKGEKLRLAGAVSGATSSEDWDNASVLRADITDTHGNGSVALVEGELKLTGGHNTYHGTTTVGNGSSEAVLTVGEGSSLGNTSTVTVNGNAALVNESVLTKAQNIVVDEAGALNLSAWRETSGLQKVSRLELTSGKSVVNGTFIGEGDLALTNKATFDVNNLSDYEYTGNVSVGEEARFALNATGGTTVEVHNNFEALPDADAGTVAFTGNGATFKLEGHSVDFKSGTFSLGDNVTISASNINALGGEDSTMTITTEGKDDEATVLFNYTEEKSNRYVTMTQTMTSGITFEKTGNGVLELSDNAMGAGAVKVEEGGAFFGEAGQTDAFDTDLTVGEDGWAAGFGGVGTLTVDRGGSFYVGGRAGYNSLLSNGVARLAEGDEAGEATGGKTVSFTVNGDVNNKGVIYVGSKTDEGAAPADSSYIGNELVIKGDYNVTASDNGGIFDMNAVIAGNDKSSADHVTITGKINGEGYIDVNYDETASTGGELEYLGLVSVNGGDDGESLKLKDKIKIGDLWYRLMWSSDENEYYLQSSVTDPGDGSWDTEDVENVGGGARSALALMQVQTFDLSIHDHIGETLYVDPVTGEERRTTFWMIQRGDWTKFDNASGQLNADGHVYTTHLGSDLITRNTDNGTVRWGLLGSFADGDFDISSSLDGKTAQGSFRGYSVGGYWAFESSAESGPFAALQLRYNWFDNENGKDEYDVDGISITAEAGYDKRLSKGTTSSGRTYEWRVEPHVRAYWTNYGDPDDYTTPLGETYSSSFDNGMMVRVGARTKIASMKGTGPAVQAYAEANWVYNNGDYSTTVSTKYGDVTSTQEGANFAELRLGLEAQFTPKVNLWVEGHHQTGSDNYESSGAMIGFKYRW